MINLNNVKKIYKKIPNKMLVPLYKVPFWFFCGSEYKKQLKEIDYFNKLSCENKKEHLDKKLINYLNDAIKHTDYYKDFAKSIGLTEVTSVDELKLFPIISKEDVVNNVNLFLDKRYYNSRYPVTTGGTTGNQLKFYLSNDCYSKEWAFVTDYLYRNNVNINDKRLCLRGVSGIPDTQSYDYNPLYKEMILSPFKLSKETLNENRKRIKEFNPKWIHGYPSSVCEFITLANSLNMELDDISHVLLVSEKIHKDQLIKIKKNYQIEILSFYGMSERVIFAEYKNGNFLCNPLYGITEEIDGELIGTGFINSATRLIRYRTGDKAIVEKNNDFVDKIIDITGRWGRDYLLGMNNEKITMTALNVHDDVFDNIERYQFVQNEIGYCDLLLQVKSSNIDIDIIKRIFQDKIGNVITITPIVVEQIELTKRGKHQFIVSSLY